MYEEYTTNEVDSLTKITPALCGFNVKPYYYCPVQKGDSEYVSYWTQLNQHLVKADASTNCHVSSAGFGSFGYPRCERLARVIGDDDFIKTMMRNEWEVMDPQGWPNVADNAACVKDVVTISYWMGDLSHSLSIVASVVASLAALLC